jgi:hypothetical protein
MIKGGIVFFLAWTLAYMTVDQECKLMGSFLVGTHMFDCKVRK